MDGSNAGCLHVQSASTLPSVLSCVLCMSVFYAWSVLNMLENSLLLPNLCVWETVASNLHVGTQG